MAEGARRLIQAEAISRVPSIDAHWESRMHEETGWDEETVDTYYNLSEELQRSYLWSHWIIRAGLRFGVYRYVPGFRHLSAGFLDPDLEGGGFGLIVHAAVTNTEMEIWLPPITIGEYEFPVVVRRQVERFDAPTVQPAGGTASCWATSRSSAPASIGPGLLTAKHVTPGVVGEIVPMDDGSSARVLDSGPEGIDVAVLGCKPPIGTRRLATCRLIAPWMTVEFRGSGSQRVIRTMVSSTNDAFGVYSAYFLPIRVFLADHGEPGDSGAIIKGPLNDVVGVYIGSLTDPRNVSGGIAQHAYQAERIMDLELYE